MCFFQSLKRCLVFSFSSALMLVHNYIQQSRKSHVCQRKTVTFGPTKSKISCCECQPHKQNHVVIQDFHPNMLPLLNLVIFFTLMSKIQSDFYQPYLILTFSRECRKCDLFSKVCILLFVLEKKLKRSFCSNLKSCPTFQIQFLSPTISAHPPSTSHEINKKDIVLLNQNFYSKIFFQTTMHHCFSFTPCKRCKE